MQDSKANREHLINEKYNLYEYSRAEVLFQNKQTRKLYTYFTTPPYNLCKGINNFRIIHDSLEKAIETTFEGKEGLLYPKQITTLQKQLAKRYASNIYDRRIDREKSRDRKQQQHNPQNNHIRMTRLQKFEQQQLKNTFEPILECLQYFQKKSITHGGISKANIVINENGDIKLRDYRNTDNCKYYYSQYSLKSDDLSNRVIDHKDDMRALGYLILQCASLKSIKQISMQNKLSNMLKNQVKQFSEGFILALIVLINKMSQYYEIITQLLNNDFEDIVLIKRKDIGQLRSIYRKLLQEISNIQVDERKKQTQCQKDRRIVVTPPFQTHSQQQMQELISKKIYPVKRASKLEDCENKKQIIPQELKQYKLYNYRQTRIGQKNNGAENTSIRKVNQMVLKKMSNKKSPTLPDEEIVKKVNTGNCWERERQTQYKAQHKAYGINVFVLNDQQKRLRTVSKKKIYQ